LLDVYPVNLAPRETSRRCDSREEQFDGDVMMTMEEKDTRHGITAEQRRANGTLNFQRRRRRI
jgi:hypothetical protein